MPATLFFGLCQRRSMLGIGCILLSFFFLNPALGQEEGTAYVSPNDPGNEYLDAIDLIEAEYGPYATELSDLHLGLGQTLMNNGDYEQARDALNRGVMVVRVNSGPNSPEQTNYLYMLANIETLLGELKEANEVLQSIYFINSNHYGEASPEILPVLERIYQWYQAMRPLDSDVSKFEDYDRALGLTEEMAKVSKLVKGMNHHDTAIAYRRLGETQFKTAYHLENLESKMYSSIRIAAGPYYDAGVQAFKKYLDSLRANEATTPLEYAEALADFGDWYTVFEKSPRRSQKIYQQGYLTLAQNEISAELADSYMSHPKPMYFVSNPQHGILEDAPMEYQEMSLEIVMTVTQYGVVRQIEVLDAPEIVSDADLWEIEKQVKAVPFRPAIKEGKVVTTRDFTWHYTVVPQREAL